MKFRVVRAVQKFLLNPIMRLVHGYLPGTALLETTGRSSGRPRRVPVGGRLIDDAFWFVSEHGQRSDYIRNIQASPDVRVRVRARWRSGQAVVLPDDDAKARARSVNFFNSLGVIGFGTELLTVKIALSDAP